MNMHSSVASLDGMDTTIVRNLLSTMKGDRLSYSGAHPFVGKNFNVTRAGIHADGLLKNEEIYNIFDTVKF